jgi:hypothetical protein
MAIVTFIALHSFLIMTVFNGQEGVAVYTLHWAPSSFLFHNYQISSFTYEFLGGNLTLALFPKGVTFLSRKPKIFFSVRVRFPLFNSIFLIG